MANRENAQPWVSGSEHSRNVVVAELPFENLNFNGCVDPEGSNLIYGFYCQQTNVFYECSSL